VLMMWLYSVLSSLGLSSVVACRWPSFLLGCLSRCLIRLLV